LNIDIRMKSKIEMIEKGFTLHFRDSAPITADRVILTTGSAKEGWDCAKALGHTIQDPVPSLFTFNISSFSLADLAGVTHTNVVVKLEGSSFEQRGALLITHWGFSGPAVLKLSAFAARYLAEKNYEAKVLLDWLPEYTENQLKEWLENEKTEQPAKYIGSLRLDSLPKSLWQHLCSRALLEPDQPLRSLSKAALTKLCALLKRDLYHLSGKTTHKEEFVTCGGVTLSEVSFRTMESKLCKGLFFAGEILDIDGVTGGFNFQNCWTTAWLAGKASVL
jgi:predicted Rossmann fold flavoprotein